MNFLSQLVQQSNLYLLTVVQGSEGWHGAERVSSDFVTELKFTCPTHSEAKQTETSVLGAEEGLLQGQARTVVAALPNVGAPWRFRWEVSTGKIGGVGCRCVTLFWLAGGEITGQGSRHPEATFLHLGGGLSSRRRAQRYCPSVASWGARILPHSCTTASWLLLLSSFSPLSIKKLFSSAFWNSGKVSGGWMKPISCK